MKVPVVEIEIHEELGESRPANMARTCKAG